MAKVYDRVSVFTPTVGTGPAQLGAAATGGRTFAAAGVPDGATVSILLDDAGYSWELSRGVYNAAAGTITRTLIASSTGALLNLTGSARLSIVASADDLNTVDGKSGGTISSALVVLGSLGTSGTITAPMIAAQADGQGSVRLNPGGAAPGYLEIFDEAGTRVGYVGYEQGTRLMLGTDDGAGKTGWYVNGNLDVAGNVGVGANLAVTGTITATDQINTVDIEGGYQLNSTTVLGYAGGILRLTDLGGGLALRTNGVDRLSVETGGRVVTRAGLRVIGHLQQDDDGGAYTTLGRFTEGGYSYIAASPNGAGLILRSANAGDRLVLTNTVATLNAALHANGLLRTTTGILEAYDAADLRWRLEALGHGTYYSVAGTHYFRVGGTDRFFVEATGIRVVGKVSAEGAQGGVLLHGRDFTVPFEWYANNNLLHLHRNGATLLTVDANATLTCHGAIIDGNTNLSNLQYYAHSKGKQLFIVDGTRPNRPIYSDGVAWRYVSDDVVVS